MVLFDFRLRFNFPHEIRINSDAGIIELINNQPKEHIYLTSGNRDIPIKDSSNVAIIGKSYNSETEAKTAAIKSKRAILYWAIDQRSGIDLGDRKQLSVVTNEGLAFYQKQYNYHFRNDIHGIDVYEHVDNIKFIEAKADATVGKYPPRLIEIFQHEYKNDRILTEKQILAGEIYASSFFDISPRSRFITLVSGIEALLEPQKKPEIVQHLISEAQNQARESIKDISIKDSIVSSFEMLRYQSIGQAGRTLITQLIPGETFQGKNSVEFFSHIYELRSRMLHDGTISDKSIDIHDLANETEAFVNRLILASLNKKLG
jgi:hypothetical protein